MGPLAEGHRHRRRGRSRPIAPGSWTASGRRAGTPSGRAAGSPSRSGRRRRSSRTGDRADRTQAASRPSVASPQTCGLAGGEYFPFTFGPELPGDQRPDDALSVCFDQPVLAEPIDIVGAPEVSGHAVADRPQANIAVRLCDVHPDGASELISYGVLNLDAPQFARVPRAAGAGRNGHAPASCSTSAAYRVPAGHRLRVAVSTAYWPMIWPSPEPVQPRSIEPATLILPLRPLAEGDEVAFPPPEGAAPWQIETLRPTQFRASCRARREDRHRHAVHRRRFRRGARSRSRPGQWQHRPRELDDPSRRPAVGPRRDALDADAVANRMVGAHRDLIDNAVRRAKISI